MNRRTLLKRTSWLSSGILLGNRLSAQNKTSVTAKPVLTIAHITDVHIRPEEDVPKRFSQCLHKLRQHKIDFILNGGDSIHAADYSDIKRERVNEQWHVWKESMLLVKDFEVFSCIGNHDPWWAAPTNADPMYGKKFVVQQLGIPDRYYSFNKKGWHFILLDGNNPGITLDEEQFDWLRQDLATLTPGTPTLVMSHYPVFGATPVLVGGNHSDHKRLKDLFYEHRDKVRIVLSGHNHLYDKVRYNKIWYCFNGAMSGYWWGKGDKDSAGNGYYVETPPGYAILTLFNDGSIENEYFPHGC